MSTTHQRKRLWDLPHRLLCPVIGICLPTNKLRGLVKSSWFGCCPDDDYELHTQAIHYAQSRNRIAKKIHKALEQRYALTIAQYHKLKSKTELLQQWQQDLQQSQLAAAFWAILTHPLCDDSIQQRVYRQIHLLQHQHCTRPIAPAADPSLLRENACLSQQLGILQHQFSQYRTEKNEQINQLNQQLMHLRAEIIGRDSRIYQLQQQFNPRQQQLTLLRLQQQVERLQYRLQRAEQQNKKLKQITNASPQTTTAPIQTTPACSAPSPSPSPLQQKTILCVGGHQHKVSHYRQIVEQHGAHYLHHDGGLEDNLHQLESSIAAADLVICQTGCISHKAYWKVKNQCKRTGKQCLYLSNPSSSSMQRQLSDSARGGDKTAYQQLTERARV